MKTIRSVAHLKYLDTQRGFEVEAFLRRRGWEHTCDTPGSYWLWSKTVGGKPLLVDQKCALRVEESEEGAACTCTDPYEPGANCPVHGGW